MLAKRNVVLRFAGLCLLLTLFAASAMARDVVKGREVWYDTDMDVARDEAVGNPYGLLVLLYSDRPVLDSKGELHSHGHLMQVIVDGGNGVQDPPNLDGTPGGDDSLALGNFNTLYLAGQEYPLVMEGKTGLFGSVKFFVPYIDDRVYYLRLWEGGDPAKAPFYQDTHEYVSTIGDQGGGLVRISSRNYAGPQELNWTFGKSQPRPKKSK